MINWNSVPIRNFFEITWRCFLIPLVILLVIAFCGFVLIVSVLGEIESWSEKRLKKFRSS